MPKLPAANGDHPAKLHPMQYRDCRILPTQPVRSSFIRYRGNIKEMERELSQSYWTIRNKLDKLITEMGLSVPPPDLGEQRKHILQQLSAGEISVEEATQKIAELGKK